MKTDETTRPVKKHTPEEIEAIRARKRARAEAEASGIEEVKRKKRTPEEIEALRAKKRARMRAEAEAEAEAEVPARKKRPRPVEDEDISEIKPKKRPRPVEDEDISEVKRKKRPRPVEDEDISEIKPKKRPRPVEQDEEEQEIPKKPARIAVPEPEEDESVDGDDYEADLGEPEDDEYDYDEEDELDHTRRAKKKEHSYTWLLILLLVMLLAAVGAFAYLMTGTRAISFDQESYTMLLGDELMLEPLFTPSFARDKTCALYSENPEVVGINADGTLVALKEGVTTISAVQNGILYGTCQITVGPIRVSGITIENVPEEMIVGESFVPEMNFVPENATHPELELTLSDDSLAELEGGTVTALAPGRLTLTATNSHSGLTKSVEVDIKPIDPESITLKLPDIVTYDVNADIEVTFDPEDVTDDTLTFTSSDPDILTVRKGELIPKGVGTVTLTAEHSSGMTVTEEVTVYPQVVISGKGGTLAQKKRDNLSVSTVPESEIGQVEWSSSNNAVVTVSNRGQIQGKGGGTAVITARLASGAVGTYEITVPATAVKCRSQLLEKGKASRRDIVEFIGMSDKNALIKLECVDDPEKSCMILVAKTGELSTKKKTKTEPKTTPGSKAKTTVVLPTVEGYRAKIPAATFNVKIAFGDSWYGQTLLFGESGEYYDLHTTYTTEKEGAFGVSSMSRAKNKEAITLDQFLG